MRSVLEVCVDSTASALAAKRGGASRLELCADLIVGGTTPSLALVRQVKNARQYDISTLFTLDGIVDMAADAELTDKKAFIKLMLHPDREV